MDWARTLWYAVVVAASVVGVIVFVHVTWRLHGMWRIRRAGPRRLYAVRHRIWREPSRSDLTDLRFGPGGKEGVPEPPFAFVEEHFSGWLDRRQGELLAEIRNKKELSPELQERLSKAVNEAKAEFLATRDVKPA